MVEISEQSLVEVEMWEMLDMNAVGSEMQSSNLSSSNQIVMGTGATHNACYMCSNSATTHGCGTCA